MIAVNVAPDMGMYNLLKNQGYDPAYAMAEFIDNAIHAWQQQNISVVSPLKITLKFFSSDYTNAKKRNTIEIIDNGVGIAKSKLADAFKPAKIPSQKGLSEFGIGMKTAAVWFGDEWELNSRPINETQKFRFLFNLDKLLTSGQDTVTIQEKTNGSNDYGTRIFLRKLRKPISLEKYTEICQDICELYQTFTSGSSPSVDLNAEYDGTPKSLNYIVPDRLVLVAPIYKTIKKTLYSIGKDIIWKEPINFTFKNQKVTGYIQLLETGSYSTNPGLVLFRYGRVVTGLTKKPYIPEKLFGTANKYGKQRIYGEIHLDGLPVSYTKDKFEFDEDELITLIKESPNIERLLKQSGDYRVNGSPTHIDSELSLTNKSKSKSTNEKGHDNGNDKSKQNNTSNDKAYASAGENTHTHVTNWETLLPSDFPKPNDEILNAYVIEAVNLRTTMAPCAAGLLCRVILERGLRVYIKNVNKFKEVKDHFYASSEGKKKNHSDEEKKAQGLDLQMMLAWIKDDNVASTLFDSEDRKELSLAAKKAAQHVGELNGLAHANSLFAANKLVIIRNEIFPLLKFLVMQSLKNHKEAT